jgi:hypothetical protein
LSARRIEAGRILAVIAILSLVPTRIGIRRPVAEALQTEIA